jgi:shikimate dehydrogenase
MSGRYAVLGSPIAHSLSPALHAAAFAATGRDATYEAIEVGADDLAEVLARLHGAGYAGLNLTSPLKLPGLRLAVSATPRAREAGAANTLRREGAGWSADNTDGAGFVRFLERAAVPCAGARVTLLGGGGASAGLVPALLAAGAASVSILSRTGGRTGPGPALRGDPRVSLLATANEPGSPAARALVASTLVVQATPLGLRPGDPLPCPPAWVGPRAVAVDLLYHPPVTPWLAALRARGIRAANGLGLLLEQALFAQEFWFGEPPPRRALEEAVAWADPFPPATSRPSPGD